MTTTSTASEAVGAAAAPDDERLSVPGDPAARAQRLRDVLDLVGGKWTPAIFYALWAAGRAVRYADLRRQLAPITPKELTKQLRGLEDAGLVARHVRHTVPPQVEYRLTSLGDSLQSVLAPLADWTPGPRVGATAQSVDGSER